MTINPKDYPILDAARPVANSEFFRVIMDFFGHLEPHIEECDTYCALPVRLVHDACGGYGIEIGPYSLDRHDIRLLEAAIAAYRQAAGEVK